MTTQPFTQSPPIYNFTQYSGTQGGFISDISTDWGLSAVPDADGETVYIFTTPLVSPHTPFTAMYVTPTAWFGQGPNGWEVHYDTEMQGYGCAYTSAPPPE